MLDMFNYFIANYLDYLLRLLMAGLIGGIIGLERESHDRPAGLRTNFLVALGSCLIMITSIEIAQTFGNGDPSRIAAQVVSGIGFLGAGTIIVKGMDIKGLTTAATLWVNAGIGLAIGAGFYFLGIVTGILVLIALVVLGRLDPRNQEKGSANLEVHTALDLNLFQDLEIFLKERNIQIISARIQNKKSCKKIEFLLDDTGLSEKEKTQLKEDLSRYPDTSFISYDDEII